MITIKHGATEEDVLYFIANIRPMDKEEVETASGLPFSIHSQELFSYLEEIHVVRHNDTIIGIGGIHKVEERKALIWLLLTSDVEKVKMEFLRFSKRHLKGLLENFDVLFNYVYLKNKLHVDWLTWLGATWVETKEGFSGFLLENRKEELDV